MTTMPSVLSATAAALLLFSAACGAGAPPAPASTAPPLPAPPSASPARAAIASTPALPSAPASASPGASAPSPPAASRVRAIALGTAHACALLDDGTLRCWGANHRGELGDGSTEDRSVPVAVAGMSGVAQVIAGAHHTCARGVDGVVRCWGEALSGRLGVAGSSGAHGPAIVPGLVGVVELASGRAHACARLDGGAVRCWGDNENGQLGRGGADQATPVAVKMPGDAPAEEIGAGGDWTCARLPKGAVHCWGIGGLGPLDPPEAGNDDAGHQKPMRNAGAISIAVGHDFVFARMDDGDLHGWGSNGDSVLLASGAPYGLGRIVHVDQAVALTAGGYHACATLRDGTARCWGANHGGELGDGTLSIPSEPKLLKGIENVAQIGLGSAFLCALDTRGVVRCTGANESGQLGDGTTKGRRSPAPVLGL